MLSYFVHKKHVIDEIVNLGVIPVNDFKLNRLVLIQTFSYNAVVILSIHNSDDQIKNVRAQKTLRLLILNVNE